MSIFWPLIVSLPWMSVPWSCRSIWLAWPPLTSVPATCTALAALRPLTALVSTCLGTRVSSPFSVGVTLGFDPEPDPPPQPARAAALIATTTTARLMQSLRSENRSCLCTPRVIQQLVLQKRDAADEFHPPRSSHLDDRLQQVAVRRKGRPHDHIARDRHTERAV